jgi:hypothetical protein
MPLHHSTTRTIAIFRCGKEEKENRFVLRRLAAGYARAAILAAFEVTVSDNCF